MLRSISLIVITPDGRTHRVSARAGQYLRDVLIAAGLPLDGTCDGALTCATCQVILDHRWGKLYQPESDDEDEVLDIVLDRQPGSRLSCQVLLEGHHHGQTVKLLVRPVV